MNFLKTVIGISYHMMTANVKTFLEALLDSHYFSIFKGFSLKFPCNPIYNEAYVRDLATLFIEVE